MAFDTDKYIKIVGKAGGCFEIYEPQIQGKTLEEIYDEITLARRNGSFYTYDRLEIDTGQIAFMFYDDRSYLVQQDEPQEPQEPVEDPIEEPIEEPPLEEPNEEPNEPPQDPPNEESEPEPEPLPEDQQNNNP